MVDFWGSVKGTVETLGGAAMAPAGAVVDLAQMPFDDKDDDFGSVVGALSENLAKTLDPVVNPQHGLLGGITRALEAMNWLYREGVSEPIGTANTMAHHVTGVPTYALLAGPLGLGAGFLAGDHNYGDIADPGAWSEAYKQANQQSNAAGASLAWGTLNSLTDPLSSDNPYEQVVGEHGALASGIAWTGEIEAMFAADPAAIALKGVGVGRGVFQYGKLNQAEKANLYTAITEGSRPGKLRLNLQSRTDKYLGFINGQNPVGRRLSAQEIYHGTPELQRYAKDPQAVAGFLADAGKITDETERLNTQRRILAIAGGDLSQVDRLRLESTQASTIADQISNMAREGVIDLDALSVAPALAQNPVFRLRLENQLSNLNKSGAVDKFIDDFIAYNDRLAETLKSLPNLPGAHQQGARAVNRLNDQGLARLPKNTLDNWSATLAQKAQSTSSVFQQGKYTVPLVAVKTVGLMASPWTKLPVAASDALRRPAFTGLASIHDWGNSAGQLDAMMDIAKVAPDARRALLDEAYIAHTESAKQTIINKVEHASMQGLARWASERSGRAIDTDYVTALMEKGSRGRGERLTSMKGRVYAATEDTTKSGKWRLDQIDEHGTPLALPVFETQLGNHVPLFDVDLAKRVLSRDTGYFARLSRAWADESQEISRLSGLKAAGATGLDKAIESRAWTRDWLVDMGQGLLRAWKFSVLFRLGYPMRVLTDDHLRIWSKIGAGSFYGPNLREFGGNAVKNLGRRGSARAAMHDLKVRRQQILSELDGNEMMVHQARLDDLSLLEKKLSSQQAALASLRRQVADEETKASLGLANNLAEAQKKLAAREGDLAEREASRDYLLEQLGDYGPTELKRELDEIEARISEGTKALREPKRRVGDADVELADGLSIPGAFGDEFGEVFRAAAGSGNTYDNLLQGAETRGYRSISGGSHRTIQPTEAGHLDAWADVLNHQIATSEVGRFFLEGGSVDDFARWIKQPEQAAVRRRVAHFAHDPEDWGHRAYGIVADYVPSDEVRQALLSGRVTPKQLREMVQPEFRPAVHGRAAADNLGTSHAMQSVGNALNRAFRFIGETPTNKLARHPYFASLYRQHAKDFYATIRSQRPAGYRFTQGDLDEIAQLSRRAALRDLKTALFDLSAHSHAAEVMRFISPFFGAHQEGVMRWWRIAADQPQIVRRFTQAMDVPRALQIEVDENGELVKQGAPLSSEHRILLQLPQAFGGKDPEVHQSGWSVSENAFNIVLQGGLTNPGTGPLVSVPMDYFAQKYADDPSIARVARIFNPFPPNNPMENAVAATLKRAFAYSYGKTGVDPSFGLGIGKREYNAAFAQNLQDATVKFQLDNDREPTRAEADELMEKVGAETTSMMFHRLLWNGLSPAPASPRSKYAVFQQGWYKIQEQARAEGKDFDWAYAQFKAKYGEAYMPLIFSTSNNPGWVDSDAASVGAIKHYKGILQKVDPALTRMVIGAYADEMIEKNSTLADYSIDARNFLRNETIAPGSDQTYYNYDEPAATVSEQMARRGWQKYGELTGALTAQAQQMGLGSYEESDELVALKRAGVEAIKAENYAFADEWDRGMDRGQFNRYIDDMRQIVDSPVLAGDAERTDIKTLNLYLELRDFFTQVFDYRKAQGWGTYEAQAQDQVRQVYTALVDRLVESNTYFEQHIYNGVIERDPLLMRNEAA